MAVLIKNGTVVTADGESKADIRIEGESIAEMRSSMHQANTCCLAE